ncbi:hypothetical protein [Cupriavidus necator]
MQSLLKILSLVGTLALACLANPVLACEETDRAKCAQTDFEGASPVYSIDLSKVKKSGSEVRVAFLPDVAALLRNWLSNDQVTAQLHKYLVGLQTSLPAGSGTLLQVRVMTDDFGNSSLPVGFLLPIGAGINPTDAYAEFINRPTITVPAPNTTARESSHFVWIEKNDQGQLEVAAIPRDFTEALLREGQSLASEKVRLRAQGRPETTYRVPDYVARADYWQKLAAERQAALAAAGRTEAVGRLVSQFADLQKEHAALKSRFEQAQRQSSENQALLGGAQLLLDLGSKWFESSGNAGTAPLSFDRSAALARQDQLHESMVGLHKTIDETTGRIKQVDESLTNVPELKLPTPM